MAKSVQQKLFDAAFQLNLAAVKRLLKQGASLKKSDKDGNDALYSAVSCIWGKGDAQIVNQKPLVELLLAEGADANKRYKTLSGWTPLILAASSGRVGALEALIVAGAEVDAEDENKYTALMRAALNGHADAVELLLNAGADVHRKANKEDALKLAREGKKEDSGQVGAEFDKTIALLVAHGAQGATQKTKSDPKAKTTTRKIPGSSETLKRMQAKFDGHKLPKLLGALCNYWDKYPERFCGSFEIDEDKYNTVKDWFQGNEAGWSRIKLFGVDGVHSLYGIWLYDGRKSDNAPIVYLGGEGEGTTILASTWEEFMSILAANQEWEPFDKKFFDSTDNNEEQNAAFRAWLKVEFGIGPAKNPQAILMKGKKEHPDFDKWLAQVIPGWSA